MTLGNLLKLHTKRLARYGWQKGKYESSSLENKKVIGDVSNPYKWEEKFWPSALLRIRSAAKAYEELNQRLDIKT